MSGGGGSTQTVQKADPWAGVQPYLIGGGAGQPGLFPGAGAAYAAGGPQYYPGSTISGINPDLQLALNAEWERAGNSPLLKQAQTLGGQLAGGEFLNSNPFAKLSPENPYLSNVIDAAAADTTRNFNNAVMPSIASQFAQGGRYGSGAQLQGISDATNNLAKQLSSTAGGIRANDYAQRQGLAANAYQYERAAQNAGIGALPGLANADYDEIAHAYNVGNIIQGNNQNNLNADIARFDYNQNLPWQNLSRYSQLLQGFGGLGGTSSQTTGSSGGFLSNALGGAMLGNSLYGLGSKAGLFGSGASSNLLSGAGGATASGLGSGYPLSFGLGSGGLFTGAAAGGGQLFSLM